MPTSRDQKITNSPGNTLGMLGGGQLGQMFCHAAQRAGYRTHVFCPGDGEPATLACDEKTIAPYDDLAAVERFAQSVSVVTYEFENVPAETAAACAKHVPVRPGQHVLHVAQDRIREKTFLSENDIPVGPFAPVQSLDELRDAAQRIGVPAVLKTAGGGYDGKGQRVLHNGDDAELVYAWEDLGRQPCVLEGFIDFEQEVSIVAARGVNGEVVCYGPIANSHRNHILDISVVPSGAPLDVESRAVEIATKVMTALDVVGVLCVEFFQTRQGTMLVNELAPRPHNSGHLTIDAFTASQFDQQVRCVTGRPPEAIELRQPAAMVNLLGDLWPTPGPDGTQADPEWPIVQDNPALHLHLYGKAQPRPGRKMGHLTALARTPHEAIRDAVEARARLAPRGRLDRD
ncbi:MAG: 5-(carboxyamino)imidazole ribonucleotide synthase [Phycisphaerales bacterium JB063]